MPVVNYRKCNGDAAEVSDYRDSNFAHWYTLETYMMVTTLLIVLAKKASHVVYMNHMMP